MSIVIFSRPIHSGKTTELLQWCNRQKNVYGILMPDINGSRKIFDLHTKEFFDIECTDAENTKEPLTTIGKYNFYTRAFEKANLIMINSLVQKPGWLIVDEIGKLELRGEGFYDAIEKAAELYSTKKDTGNLLITVRDSLCNEVIRFFNFADCRIIHSLGDLDK